MALSGKNAYATFAGGATIRNTNNWTVTISGNPIETPSHLDEWMYRVAGIADWSASIDAHLDPAKAQQTPIQNALINVPQSEGTFQFYVSATNYYEGEGYVESVDAGAPADGALDVTWAIVGNGTLSYN